MPGIIAALRTETDDRAWAEKTVTRLNADAASGLNQGSFPLATFTFNHTGMSPALDVRDPDHPKIASPGSITWLIADWIAFPDSAAQVTNIWRDTYFLAFDEKLEVWNYRITRDDLTNRHQTLEQFLRPTYQVLAADPEFRQLLASHKAALELCAEVKASLEDRVDQPKQLKDLIKLF